MKFINTKEYIEKEIDRLNLPYIACIVKKDGKEVFNYHYYREDNGNDLLDFYSMSKPITVVALLQLVEQGLISIDDEVSKYLPSFTNLHLLTGEKVDTPITITHLLSMTSGLDYDLGRKAVVELKTKNPHADTLEVCSTFAQDGLKFIPGTSYQYSLSIDVAAAIIEKITGQRFSSYVKEHIFKPLGIEHSTFAHDSELAKATRDEYIMEGNKLVKSPKWYEGFHPTKNYESGGAGLISTPSDYSLFIDSLAARSEKLIKDKTVDIMAKLRVTDTPFSDKTADYSKNSEEYGYGFGVRVRKIPSKYGLPVGEFGWDGAVGSYSLCDRENKISIVIGLSVQVWPSCLPNLHLDIANMVYKDIFNK